MMRLCLAAVRLLCGWMRIFVWRPSEKGFFRRLLCHCYRCVSGGVGAVWTALSSLLTRNSRRMVAGLNWGRIDMWRWVRVFV
ncbi:MAG: hypothetical protein Q4D63_05220 [Neisseria animaloris]|nr:hypothetical protein [Neisseria animaloris]